MKRINPNSLYGSRAYFTDIGEKIVRFKLDRNAYRREVERRLKILLIIKKRLYAQPLI